MNRAIATSTTNDNLRQLFFEFLNEHLEFHAIFYKYGKMKGWTEIEPAYRSNKQQDKEPLALAEANHLWDHLNLRYDQLFMTITYKNFVHDTEFKMMLELGESELKDQIKGLESLAVKYAIPLPERPPG